MDLRKKTDMADEPYNGPEIGGKAPLYKEEPIGFDMDNDLSNDQPSDIERINMSIYSSLSAARTICIIMSLFVGGVLCFAFTPVGLAVLIGGVLAALKLKSGAGWTRSVCAVVSVMNMLFGVIVTAAGISSALEGEFDTATGITIGILCLLFFILPLTALFKMYVPRHVREFFYRNKRR